jgi:predicted nucleic acid-binding protein
MMVDSNIWIFAEVAEYPEKETLKNAVALASAKGLRINDAVLAQHCLEQDMELLTDNVKDFRKVVGLQVAALR